MALARGLYEILLTELLAEELSEARVEEAAELDALRNAEAADRVALHLAKVVEAAIEMAPEDSRTEAGARLARGLIELIANEIDASFTGRHLKQPARI